MRRISVTLIMLAALASVAGAQGSDAAAAKPGRNPNQPIDAAYTAKIKQYTTEPFFLSPLVDYMPAKAGVPTPMAELGDIAGAPGKLPYSKEVYDYMRMLAKALPGRVKVYSIGTPKRAASTSPSPSAAKPSCRTWTRTKLVSRNWATRARSA